METITIFELLLRSNNVIFCGGATALKSRSMNDTDIVLDIEAKEVLSRRAKGGGRGYFHCLPVGS